VQGFGGLSGAINSKLNLIASGGDPAIAPSLAVGSKLQRECNGVSHSIDVIENDFKWRSQHFRSLFTVARSITGTQWYGPPFFGLTKGAKR